MKSIKLIFFVDRGDIARAPIAAAITNQELIKLGLQDRYVAFSRRTQGIAPDDPVPNKYLNLSYYPAQFAYSKEWLKRNMIDLASRCSTGINSWDAEKAAIIFSMDENTRASLRILFPDQEIKIYMFSEIVGESTGLVDPEFVDGTKKTEQIYDQIKNTIIDHLSCLLGLVEETREGNREPRESTNCLNRR